MRKASSECLSQSCDAFVRSQRFNGWFPIEERFEDDGYSGAACDRPALSRVLDLIRKREVDRLVIYRLDRLSRSLFGCASILHELRESGVGLVIVTAPELWNSAQDGFMLNILTTFAEFEREDDRDAHRGVPCPIKSSRVADRWCRAVRL